MVEDDETAAGDAIEAARLSVLRDLHILDTPAEPEFDTIVECARQALRCKIALVSLIDADRQWFKAKCGLDAGETPREHAFCAHAILGDDMMVVADAAADPRFAANPLVLGAPHIRFYAGAPIRVGGAEGAAIGTLCVIDDRPRALSAEERVTLASLARLAEALIDARNATAAAKALAAQRHAALLRLDLSDRRFRQAERMVNIGSWRLTIETGTVEWSDQVYRIHGLPVGTDLMALPKALNFYPPRARAQVDEAIRRVIETGQPFDIETDFVTAQGEQRRVRSIGEIKLRDGKPLAVIGVFQDVTDRYALEQALRRSATIDDLTGLANRARFNEVLDAQFTRARAGDLPLTLLLIDLDHFKRANDLCGHHAGDELLRATAGRLQSPHLGDSFAARLGGDEFILLVSAPAILADLPGFLRRLLAELRQTVSTGNETVGVTATIGACRLDDAIGSPSDMLRCADTALYGAKRRQRGTAMIAGDAMIIPPADDMPRRLRIVG